LGEGSGIPPARPWGSIALAVVVAPVIIVAALAIFAYQNNESVTFQYFRRSITLPMSVLIAAVYVLGLLSGWMPDQKHCYSSAIGLLCQAG
jgi:uncharacterized integral membrane protein